MILQNYPHGYGTGGSASIWGNDFDAFLTPIMLPRCRSHGRMVIGGWYLPNSWQSQQGNSCQRKIRATSNRHWSGDYIWRQRMSLRAHTRWLRLPWRNRQWHDGLLKLWFRFHRVKWDKCDSEFRQGKWGHFSESTCKSVKEVFLSVIMTRTRRGVFCVNSAFCVKYSVLLLIIQEKCLNLQKIGCTRQFESKLSLRSFAQSMQYQSNRSSYGIEIISCRNPNIWGN